MCELFTDVRETHTQKSVISNIKAVTPAKITFLSKQNEVTFLKKQSVVMDIMFI